MENNGISPSCWVIWLLPRTSHLEASITGLRAQLLSRAAEEMWRQPFIQYPPSYTPSLFVPLLMCPPSYTPSLFFPLLTCPPSYTLPVCSSPHVSTLIHPPCLFLSSCVHPHTHSPCLFLSSCVHPHTPSLFVPLLMCPPSYTLPVCSSPHVSTLIHPPCLFLSSCVHPHTPPPVCSSLHVSTLIGEGWAKWTRWAKRKTQITLRRSIIKLSNFGPL